MATGLLTIHGHIDITRYWPQGESDADTTTLQLQVGPGAFDFRPREGLPSQPTEAFTDAIVTGRVRKPLIQNGRISVRLQGIDAPELHYTPAALLKKADQTKTQHERYLQWNHKYRQFWAESATLALRNLLQSIGGNPIPCTVISRVDDPNDVADAYGRFVGDALVTVAGVEVDLNYWLAERGWVLPAFYNSMTEPEMSAIQDLCDQAWSDDAGLWPYLADQPVPFDWGLRYRPGSSIPTPASGADHGPAMLPKLFRRQAQWALNRKAKMFNGSFATFLASRDDNVILREDFVAQGPAATVYDLNELLPGGDTSQYWPEDLVFVEAKSTIRGPGGALVHW